MVATMKLSLGAGYVHEPGWTTLDLNPMTKPDIVGAAYPLPLGIAAESVAEIRAVDVLEHLSWRDTTPALMEWAGVLIRGGRLYLQVPDADTIMHAYVACQTPGDRSAQWLRTMEGHSCSALEGATWRLCGGHRDGTYADDDDDWRWNAHYALFSPESLRAHVENACLRVESMTVNAHPNICCWAVKP